MKKLPYKRYYIRVSNKDEYRRLEKFLYRYEKKVGHTFQYRTTHFFPNMYVEIIDSTIVKPQLKWNIDDKIFNPNFLDKILNSIFKNVKVTNVTSFIGHIYSKSAII